MTAPTNSDGGGGGRDWAEAGFLIGLGLAVAFHGVVGAVVFFVAWVLWTVLAPTIWALGDDYADWIDQRGHRDGG